MKKTTLTLAAIAVLAAGCAALSPMPSSQELDGAAQAMMKASFREQGIAKLDRIEQDLGQKACSSPIPPAPAVANQIETAALASVKWPADGRYLGDWKEGEKLAQNGRGMTWTDAAGSANGGSCYNCHQIGKAELSFGTIGPSLYQYGKLRGVADPANPASEAIVKYTWAKLWNSKAYSACSNMPRFGHAGLLTEDQIRNVMALLLDPKSPVNQ
ncbi:sulfur oxidation c-type cytochrome SoxX [Caldimonas sp. KR1-144]|uniref:sulfur oxidation c-type cytochrome SoxX n=1 Tax=Caldimonas sp. KR1-144 TaxID=3400911 RepID=UPI003C0FE813